MYGNDVVLVRLISGLLALARISAPEVFGGKGH